MPYYKVKCKKCNTEDVVVVNNSLDELKSVTGCCRHCSAEGKTMYDIYDMETAMEFLPEHIQVIDSDIEEQLKKSYSEVYEIEELPDHYRIESRAFGAYLCTDKRVDQLCLFMIFKDTQNRKVFLCKTSM